MSSKRKHDAIGKEDDESSASEYIPSDEDDEEYSDENSSDDSDASEDNFLEPDLKRTNGTCVSCDLLKQQLEELHAFKQDYKQLQADLCMERSKSKDLQQRLERLMEVTQNKSIN